MRGSLRVVAAMARRHGLDGIAAGPGPEICKACHEKQTASYDGSIHGKKGHPASPANAGQCSTCHGDATEHVKAGGGRGVGGIQNPGAKGLSAEQKDKICLSCHASSRHLAFWDSGKHRKNDVTCADCHNTHGGNQSLLRVDNPSIAPLVNSAKVPQQEVCFTCHRDIRALAMRRSPHPIVEGKIKCTSCHNRTRFCPASGQPRFDQSCATPAIRQRGPFLRAPPVEGTPHCLTRTAAAREAAEEKAPTCARTATTRRSIPGPCTTRTPTSARPWDPPAARTPGSSRAAASTATSRSTAATRRRHVAGVSCARRPT